MCHYQVTLYDKTDNEVIHVFENVRFSASATVQTVKKYINSYLEDPVALNTLHDNRKEIKTPGKISDLYPDKKITIYYEDKNDWLECPICTSEVQIKNYKDFSCGHRICITCSLNLRDTKCPVCRIDISSDYSKYHLKIISNKKKSDEEERKNIEIEESEKLARSLVREELMRAGMGFLFLEEDPD